MESDFNTISTEQLKESIVRLKTYESLGKIHNSRKRNQKPEYSILSYLNNIEQEEKNEILFVIEKNNNNNSLIIIEKITTLLHRFPNMRFGFINYYLDQFKILCCSHSQFKCNENFCIKENVCCFVDDKYNKNLNNNICFNELLTKAIEADWENDEGNKVIIFFSNSSLVFDVNSNELIQVDAQKIDKLFIIQTQKRDSQIQIQLNENIKHINKIEHISWSKLNLNECLLNKQWFNELLIIDLMNDRFEGKEIKLKQLKDEAASKNDEITIKGILISIPGSYKVTDACYKTYGVNTTFYAEPSLLKIQLKYLNYGGFKVMYRGVLNNQQEVAIKYDHGIINNNFDNYIGIMEGYSVASKFAEEFQGYGNQPIKCVDIKMFIETSQVIEKKEYGIDEIRKISKGNTCFLIEPLLKGQFLFWNKNDGRVILHNYSATLNCFSHFSYVRSGRRLLIDDIQGVVCDNSYLITDIAIHHETCCRFGCSGDNHGFKGMNNFLQNHICNSCCIKIKINGLNTFEYDEDLQTIFPIIPMTK